MINSPLVNLLEINLTRTLGCPVSKLLSESLQLVEEQKVPPPLEVPLKLVVLQVAVDRLDKRVMLQVVVERLDKLVMLPVAEDKLAKPQEDKAPLKSEMLLEIPPLKTPPLPKSLPPRPWVKPELSSQVTLPLSQRAIPPQPQQLSPQKPP
jgi:hypothetical protein